VAVTLRPLDRLDPQAVQAVVAETVQRVQEDNPHLDLRRGVFAELLVYYHAVLDAQRRAFVADLLASRSLQAVAARPDLADPDVVDDILSNFRVTRRPGRKAAGEVTVVVSDDVTVTVPQGSVWEARGRRYVAPRVYTAKAERAQVVGPGDRLLTPRSDGRWSFTITVEAAEPGEGYAVPKDALVVPLSPPPNYVTSYAAADFTPGRAPETTADLLGRLREGVAARALSNRVNMVAALRSVPAFAGVSSVSIIGHGDPELVRARRSVLGLAFGGRCDWYVRTQELPLRQELTVRAVLVEKGPRGGVWQFGVGRDVVPGFYEFRDVRPADQAGRPAAGGYEVVADARGFDLTGDGWVPDLADPAEAAYSPFSTAVVRFLDTSDHSGLAVGAVRPYVVTAVVMPQLADVQAFVSSRDVRPYGGDVLVRAPVPCFLTVRFTVHCRPDRPAPDVDRLRLAVCRLVNSVGFAGAVYASQVHDAVYAHLEDGQTVSSVDMVGRLRYPGGAVVRLRDAEVLAVPDDPAAMVSPRTVQFFCWPEDVGVTVAAWPSV